MTLPIGMPRTSASSWYERPSSSRSTEEFAPSSRHFPYCVLDQFDVGGLKRQGLWINRQRPVAGLLLIEDVACPAKESIDLGTYERQCDRLREELTLVEIDRHGSKVEEFDVEGILNFAERVLPRAADLWIQASLEQRQRLQRLFFPEGVAFSGKSFDRTVVTSSLFEHLRPLDRPQENLVDQNCASWNQFLPWLRQLDILRSGQALIG